jgi:hypothetical protein
MSIGGHTFAQTPAGRRCTAYCSSTGMVCGIPWLHTRTCRLEDIDKTLGIVHHGTPTAREFAEIQVEVIREEAAIWAAVLDAASAGSH